ncbi:hypothetical protein TPHA_0F01840 [Tetrapisispora phaffii CBS 4417]|uniref:RING-type E3 ubiquitin transferase n=1 Tax=Tetrapisispora phaffii (strain ATCC 24235 / CBS 4417 / NBRC 1672 / NRRL Y-8282 / UCD 70-5) TaxID=1071381 RepID=G8BV85_TETPH|nr:hypothetical protein TPHA_0F01840 [Tetrapisispora phaffii CBS 4417]CCE63667.1 hypothetical protein TPHA_0F01840 [Tetrapisispora phaffii CBS 4417]
MLTPIPFQTNQGNNNSTNGVNNPANNNSTNSASSGRRRGSSFNMILNTFGIRPNNSNTNSANNSNVNLSTNASNSASYDTTNNTTTNNENSNNAASSVNPNEFYQLPISLSLTSTDNNNTNNDNNNSNNNNNNNNDDSNNGNNQSDFFFNLSSNLSNLNGNMNSNTITANVSTNPVDNSNTNSINDLPNTNDALRNLRHYIYGANQENPDSLLQLDLPPNGRAPEACDVDSVRRRKDKNGLFSIRLTPFIDTSSSSNPGLYFDPVIRTAGPGSQLVIGRYTERVREAISKVPENYHPVVFKSKVVSRTHGCLKVDSNGNWYVKDAKSSSGTFLNHQRLSPASTLSKDTILNDGDILQLGMDFRGGTEEIYRCVKMRVELNKSWKRKANTFNKEALQRIRNLQQLTSGLEEEDCSICLSAIKPCQAIFISPCSHSWHFHCIRRLVMMSYPQFVCPNCRSSCDLEASLESSSEDEGDMLIDDENNVDDDLPNHASNENAEVNEAQVTSMNVDSSDENVSSSTD